MAQNGTDGTPATPSRALVAPPARDAEGPHGRVRSRAAFLAQLVVEAGPRPSRISRTWEATRLYAVAGREVIAPVLRAAGTRA